ncbi:MAG: hypothetical protein Q9Q40_04170 [Acidobacteriota bacterium]|nr:hypothetical protein [Acidobacteriota bacterium]MDQ7088189.1 hypothetical protein [Acidobacteriota bacterium]
MRSIHFLHLLQTRFLRSSGLVAVLALVSTGWSPWGAVRAAEGGRIFLSERGRHQVAVYRPDGTRLATITTGISPRGMAAHEGKLYVANWGHAEAPGSSLTRIDLGTLRADKTISACIGCAPLDLFFDGEDRLWMVGQNHHAVYRLDPPWDKPAASVLVSWGWPVTLAPLGESGKILVGMRASDDLAILDPVTMKASTLTVGPVPGEVLRRPGHDEGWVITNPMNAVHRITASGAVEGEYRVEAVVTPNYLGEGVFTADGRYLLLTCQAALGMLVFDPDSGEVVADLKFEKAPRQIALSPSGQRAAVLIPAQRQLAIVDLSDPEAPRLERTMDLDGEIGDVLWLP